MKKPKKWPVTFREVGTGHILFTTDPKKKAAPKPKK